MNKFHTSCPAVDRTEETFVEHVTVGGERKRVEFTKPIIWLQESEARLQFIHGGKVLKEGSTYNDFYGYLTSFGGDTEIRAMDFSKAFSITPESSLELVILASVYRVPVIEPRDCADYNRTKPANYKRQYAYVPDYWRKEVVEDGQTILPRMGRVLLESAVVWSSKNTPEQNDEIAAQFRAKWAVQKERAQA